MDERARRIGQNEILFRDVNERLRELNESFSLVLENAEFVCECGDASCVERITMTLADYEELRRNPTRFAIRKGHEIPDVEDVVGETPAYAIVQKREGLPARLAAQHDPRA